MAHIIEFVPHLPGVPVSLIGTGRLGAGRGHGRLASDIALVGGPRFSGVRGSAGLVTDVSLETIARITAGRGQGVVSFNTGLDFPGNVDWPSASTSILFGWNVADIGTVAPFAAYPATYIWRAFPRTQVGFWTFLFHAKKQGFPFDQETANEYYGMHPFQDQFAQPPGPIPPEWEISSHGGDTFQDPVVFNQWYTQVAVVSESGGTEFHTYYWNWPNVTTDVVTASGASKAVATNPCIVVGDAPWNPGFECPNAILRGYQFYDGIAMTTQQITDSIANPSAVQTPWYLNLDPTPDDISDKSGNGNHPAWWNANRPGLWTG